MHGQIASAIKQGSLYLLRKQPDSAAFAKRPNFDVTAGDDRNHLDFRAQPFQLRGDKFGLPPG
jgi:hypothetical protein